MVDQYDLIDLGSGPGGCVKAVRAAQLMQAFWALVEKPLGLVA